MRFGIGQNFAQRFQGGRVRMADRNGLIFFARFAQCKAKLAADGADFRNIIEKRNIARRSGDTGAARGIERDGCGGGATVDVKELVIAEHGHEFVHQLDVGGGFRALVIVDAGDAGYSGDESVDQRSDLTL